MTVSEQIEVSMRARLHAIKTACDLVVASSTNEGLVKFALLIAEKTGIVAEPLEIIVARQSSSSMSERFAIYANGKLIEGGFFSRAYAEAWAQKYRDGKFSIPKGGAR